MPSMGKEYTSVWYQKNKEIHLKYLTEKLNCEVCNIPISRVNMGKHLRSKSHHKTKLALKQAPIPPNETKTQAVERMFGDILKN